MERMLIGALKSLRNSSISLKSNNYDIQNLINLLY